MAKKHYGYLSAYEIMWMLVLFDLPVTEKEWQIEAGKFRQTLKELGFYMAQYSVYYKMIGGKECQPRIEKSIERALPRQGQVDILYITDKQFGEIKHYYARKKSTREKEKPQQYLLF